MARHAAFVSRPERALFTSNASADLGNAQPAADLAREDVHDLGMSRDGLDLAGRRVDPQRVRAAFALEDAAVQAEVLQQGAALHAVRPRGSRR